MTSTEEPQLQRVMFAKRKDPALIMGRTLPQLVFLTAAGALLVLFLRALPAGQQHWWMLITAGALVPLGWLRVRGRGVADTGPSILADLALRLLRQREYRGGPHRRAATDTAATPKTQPRLPGTLKHLEFEGFDAGGRGEQGVVFDRSDGTLVIVLEVAGQNFALLDTTTANAFVLGFQQLQDGLARRGSPIVGIQCLERVIPDLGEEAAREWQRRGGRGPRFAQRANEALLESEVGRGISHTSLIAVRIDPARAKSQVKELGGGDVGKASLAFKVAAGLESDLEAAGLTVVGMLPPRAIAAHCRSALDPASDEMIARRGGGAGDTAGGDEGLPSGAAPVSVEPSRVLPASSYLWHEDHVSRTWWVEEYPRASHGVTVGFLHPLLLRVPHRHTVTILLQPLERRAAERQINEQASRADATNRIDRKIGRRKSRAKEREERDMDRREVDLTEGYANYRAVTLVSATARNVRELELISADIEAAMNNSFMEGHIWYVETDQAFYMAALPLARGLL